MSRVPLFALLVIFFATSTWGYTLALDWRSEIEWQVKDSKQQSQLAHERLHETSVHVLGLTALHIEDLAERPGLTQAEALREYVYTRTVIGDGDFDPTNPVEHILRMAREPVAMECGGMAATYRWMLAQIGIPARTVQLASRAYVDGHSRFETHVGVEVYDAQRKRLYVSDPTFNVSFSCNGGQDLLDYQSLKACLERGERVTAVRNGQKYIEGRTVETYALPYDRLLYAIKAAELDIGDARLRTAVDLPSPDWMRQSSAQYVN